jgi:hypothetical protein
MELATGFYWNLENAFFEITLLPPPLLPLLPLLPQKTPKLHLGNLTRALPIST